MKLNHPIARLMLLAICVIHSAGCSPKVEPNNGPGDSPGQAGPNATSGGETSAAAESGTSEPMDGAAFLEANKSKPGVIVTESGLQYQVIKSGTGKTPTKSDRVTTHYTGTLIDGSKFDSSVDRGQPAVFGVTQVISGWTEALQLMKEGDKWKLFIPYELAYGAQGRPPTIPPAATLIFEIELIKVN